MAFFHRTRVTYIVGIRVFNKDQKENLLECADSWADKTKVKSYTSITMDYELTFNYATNYYGFKKMYDSSHYGYKGKILYVDKD